MENIKNTPEDNGKIVVRISNKLAFSYVHEPDHIFIDDDMNNYRYATKEEGSIYNTNKSPDDRFYSLYNAPELRQEILKERIEDLHEVYKLISSDTIYKLVTSDMSRKYWEHELNNAKDKEIDALKKQVSSLIKYKDELSKNTTMTSCKGWDSTKNNGQARFDFSLYITDIEKNQFEDIKTRELMDKIQLTVNKHISNLK